MTPNNAQLDQMANEIKSELNEKIRTGDVMQFVNNPPIIRILTALRLVQQRGDDHGETLEAYIHQLLEPEMLSWLEEDRKRLLNQYSSDSRNISDIPVESDILDNIAYTTSSGNGLANSLISRWADNAENIHRVSEYVSYQNSKLQQGKKTLREEFDRVILPAIDSVIEKHREKTPDPEVTDVKASSALTVTNIEGFLL